MREPDLVASSSASARGVIEGNLAPADETACDHGPGPDRGLSEALDEHVREQGSCKIVAYGRELSGLYYADADLNTVFVLPGKFINHKSMCCRRLSTMRNAGGVR